MKLISYIYGKYFLSLFISILVTLVIFYIFSLIGNLGENINFISILYLSFLNSIQILLYVPSIIILLSFILMIAFLRSKNEITIIKEYFSSNKILTYFFPIIIIYSIFEINKDVISKYVNNTQLNFTENNKNYDFKIVVNEIENKKIYTVLKGMDLNLSRVNEMRRFFVSNGKIIGGEISDNLQISNNDIFAYNLTEYKMDKINKATIPRKILNGLNNYIDDKIVHHSNRDKKELINWINIFFRVLYLILFFYSLLLILLSKKAINKKNNFMLPIFICLLLVLYTLIIISLPINFLDNKISILALFFIFFTFLKYHSYE